MSRPRFELSTSRIKVWSVTSKSACSVQRVVKLGVTVNIVKECWQKLFIKLRLNVIYKICSILSVRETCALTVQRGKFCVRDVPTWGHIDAAFTLFAFEHVSVGIEGCTAETRSHLRKHRTRMTQSPSYKNLRATTPTLNKLRFVRQTSNRNWFRVLCTSAFTVLGVLQRQWDYAKR